MCVAGSTYIIDAVQEAARGSASSGWWLEVFKAIFAPAFVAIFFTGFTNFFLERAKGRREAVSTLSSGLRSELNDLQGLGAEYWSKAKSKNDAALEAKIMASLEAVSTGLLAFQKERKINLSDDIDGWIVTLRDVLTGGAFQTDTRAADFSRVQNSASHITKMRYKIFEERLRRM